jgi:integrase
MARKRTGTLVPKPSGWFARVWVTREGVEKREFINLETTDKATARRKLAKLVTMLASGELVAEARESVTAPETLGSYVESWCQRREAAGIVMARDERHNLTAHVLPVVGASTPLASFADSHGDEVLEAARDKGLGWETVRKVRAVMHRLFERARREKLVAENPIRDVELPDGLRRDKRQRVILTDDEIRRYLGTPGLSIEVKMASLVARTEGGMRTAELLRWEWTMVSPDFTTCTIRRAKTGDVQTLDVPMVLRPILRHWHELAGKPASGPVFPAVRGDRKGLAKLGRGYSFAARLRRDLFRAAVVRLPPGKDEHGHPVPNPSDPLYFDTPISRRVDFHSFRRSYATSLARAGHEHAERHGPHLAHGAERAHGVRVVARVRQAGSGGRPAGDYRVGE